MPSPKPILRDIADFGLDPKKAYTITNKQGGASGGRITVAPKPGAKHDGYHINQRTLSVEPPTVEAQKKAEPTKVETPKAGAKVSEEPKKAEEKVLEPTKAEVKKAEKVEKVVEAPEEKKEEKPAS
jgi:hypothetical protein